MDQFMLFVELSCLIATAYLYWLTWKRAQDISAALNAGLKVIDKLEERSAVQGSDVVDTVREVTRLLDQWQIDADAARAEWTQQYAELQTTLKQAEATGAALRQLMWPGEDPEGSRSANPFAIYPSRPVQIAAETTPPQPDLVSPVETDVTRSPTQARAIIDFGHFLRAHECNQAVIINTCDSIQKFLIWLSGPNFAELPPLPVNQGQVDAYASYLEHQGNKTGLESHEFASLNIFARWLNSRLAAPGPAPASPLPDDAAAVLAPVEPPVDRPASSSQMLRQYRSVFALAYQGLDTPAITEATGLEREAVRILLTMGQNEYRAN